MYKHTLAAITATLTLATLPALADDKELLWGDTHLHTSYSFDAFLNGNLSADPEVAYRYAKGLPVIHPYNRTRVSIDTPLDFLVVTDHAEFYGGIRDIYYEGVQDDDPNIIESIAYWYNEKQIRDAINTETGIAFFSSLLPVSADPYEAVKEWTKNTSKSTPPGADVSARNAWARARQTAEEHNDPGTFTTILGWEWSTVPGGANLHRVVMTDASGETAGAFQPYSSTISPYPEDLWQWMAETAAKTGANFLAIPHNSNISKGVMFADITLRGEAMTADYAKLRSEWEPLTEITQIKGDSETHPDLSPNDPYADFETYPFYIQQDRTAKYVAAKGDYIRSALREGLRLEKELGTNPFRFGVIGSTDSHTGLSSAEEPNFWGKMAFDSVPERKQKSSIGIGPTGWSMSASGLAAVWAEENTRESILAAFKRREVYATTGPRIRLKFSATTDTQTNIPMGGVVDTQQTQSPSFSVVAQRDPKSASLDRVQIIKGWLDVAGDTHEQVFDVAWSGNRRPNQNGIVAKAADTVNRKTGTWQDNLGSDELVATWTDPNFEPNISAFYYARVLEIPTPRHALLDAIALGIDEPTEGASVIQERAYSSAIWYQP